jgi:hypothetical protein
LEELQENCEVVSAASRAGKKGAELLCPYFDLCPAFQIRSRGHQTLVAFLPQQEK